LDLACSKLALLARDSGLASWRATMVAGIMAAATRPFEIACGIVAQLGAAGYEAYLAGGCVRDLLMGREPKDYDVATSATPDVVLGMFPRTFGVGAHFGVVLVATEVDGDGDSGGKPEFVLTEVATFRSDGAYSDGRHPDAVRYTQSAEEDVRRRDFTINGLLLDPAKLPPQGLKPHSLEDADVRAEARTFQTGEEIWGEAVLRSAVIDYVGGIADLNAGVVRAIGRAELRFEEDHLRMLRGVRFAARFGFELEQGTRAAMRALALRVNAVSRERVRDELTKMLTEGHARRAFELLDETGLLAQVLPEIAKMKGVEQPPQFHPEGDVWTHTLMLLEQLEPGCEPTLAWGALLHDVGKRQILALIEHHMQFADAQKMKASTLKRFFRLERFDQHLALHRMDCLAASRNLDHWEFVRERYEAMPEQIVRPQPLLTGSDLIAAGYAPGPTFKEMLRTVEDAQLEGTISTEDEAMGLVKERFGEGLGTRD
jgi:poly(A) polymerase